MTENIVREDSLEGLSLRLRCAFFVCLCMALFHLYTAGIDLMQQQIQRAVHVGFMLVIIFLLHPIKDRRLPRPLPILLDMACLAGSVAGAGYIVLFYGDIALRGGVILQHELVLGLITMLLVLEAGRRVLGKALPILAIIFLLYCYFGNYAPGFMEIRGYSVQRIVQHMYLTGEGIFGVAIGVSSTYIFMFILFGSFLVSGGGAQLFNNLALAIAGRLAGGPAKVAVIASGLMGTINGSSIANAATVGTLTIPMMKKAGYTPEEAAGIEACSSTGGQLMPPIMGAGAFIMAEFLKIPYLTIAAAAIIPAALYYAAIFMHVHFIAKRNNIKGIETGKRVWAILRRDGYLLLPVLLIVVMLILRYTPLKAAFWAIVAIYCLSLVTSRNRIGLNKLMHTLAGGARGAVSTASACAVVGFIVGTCSLTSLGVNFSINIVDLTNGSLLVTLLLSMLACLILGMGLPTTANYIVTSTIIAPALIKMDPSLGLAAHLFVFYFGIMADITPPVCLATFTAAGIAKANPGRAGLTALGIALPSFFLPYLFIFSPDILLQGSLVNALLIAAFAVCGVAGITAAIQGWLAVDLNIFLRLACLVGGVLCFLPLLPAKCGGLALLAGVFALAWLRRAPGRVRVV